MREILGIGEYSFNGGTLQYGGGGAVATPKPFTVQSGGMGVEVTGTSTTLTLAGTLAGALAMVALAVIPVSSRGDLTSSYNAHQQQAKQLQSTIGAESGRIDSYRGTISSLEQRLIRLLIVVPVAPLLVVAGAQLPALIRLFLAVSKALRLLLFADV